MERLLIVIFIEIAIYVGIIFFIASSISNGGLLTFLGVCLAAFALAIIGAFMRGEDKFEVGEGRARHFMTLGHASVIVAILGLISHFIN